MRILALIFALCLVGCDKPQKVDFYKQKPRDLTIGHSSVCEVHNLQMVRTPVPVSYGLHRSTELDRSRYVASTNAFPHAERYCLGGCVIMPDSPKIAYVYICPECKTVAAKWDLSYGKR